MLYSDYDEEDMARVKQETSARDVRALHDARSEAQRLGQELSAKHVAQIREAVEKLVKAEHDRPTAPVTVVSTVLWSAGEVLLGKRASTCDAPGLWCCPGGKADTPGLLVEHAVREIAEETGLVVAPETLRALPAWREYVDEHGQSFTVVYFERVGSINRSEARCAEPDRFEGWSFWDPFKLPNSMFEGEKLAIAASAARGLM